MQTPQYYSEPVLTLLARPSFVSPEHLPVNWIGESTDGERLAEFAGRLCYMSQQNPAKRETREYLENIKKQGHGSVLEHASYTILLEGVSRSLTHELVRHRAGFAYSQLSQRYVDESQASFVVPPAMVGDEKLEGEWRAQMEQAQTAYVHLVAELMERYGWIGDKVHRRKMAREASRAVLPNATETKIVVTGNARAWRTMLELRSSEGAELEIRRMAIVALRLLQGEAPGFFSDFEIYMADDRREAARISYHKV
jgi:thymidylate synthase (FAD)